LRIDSLSAILDARTMRTLLLTRSDTEVLLDPAVGLGRVGEKIRDKKQSAGHGCARGDLQPAALGTRQTARSPPLRHLGADECLGPAGDRGGPTTYVVSLPIHINAAAGETKCDYFRARGNARRVQPAAWRSALCQKTAERKNCDD
jgi:hypothetical protein